MITRFISIDVDFWTSHYTIFRSCDHGGMDVLGRDGIIVNFCESSTLDFLTFCMWFAGHFEYDDTGSTHTSLDHIKRQYQPSRPCFSVFL